MNDIAMVRNTTQKFAVSLTDAEGQPYVLGSGEVLRFGVKKTPRDSEYLVTKNFSTYEEGNYVFTLDPDDTSDIDYGDYSYDIGLESGSDYYMVVKCGKTKNFHLLPNITEPEDE